MAKVEVQDVTVTQSAGTAAKAEFAPITIAPMTVLNFAVVKANENVTFELDPVQGG